LEHFQLLMAAVPVGCADYDARTRNETIERSPVMFLEALDAVVSQLSALDQTSMTLPLNVRMLVAPGTERIEIASTLGRELAFVSSHAIHHIAIITALAESMGIVLPEGYGVAYSTSAHRSTTSVVLNGQAGSSSCAR
jgi:uncharacterized damage-inducible protein DinB